jgi:hypothetical protein
MNRLFFNYFVKSEINIFYSSLSKINVENILVARAKFRDLNTQLNNTEFVFFDSSLKHQLREQLHAIRNKIIEVELEEELTTSKVNFETLKKSI